MENNRPYGPVKQAANVISSAVLIAFGVAAACYVGVWVFRLFVLGLLAISGLLLLGGVTAAAYVLRWAKRKGWY